MNMDALVGLHGRPDDIESADELNNIAVCPECGQAFDMRDLFEVFYHDNSEEHAPLPRH